MTELIHAPWTAEQVTALNAFQHHGRMHPFTCGATHASGQSPVLVATNSGWVCPDPQCVYRQYWAHAFMAAPAVSVPSADQTTDRAALRQRIAEAVREAACPGDCGKTEEQCAKERIQPFAWHHGRLAVVEGEPEQFADAVLAVLPEPADRAAILNEAATVVEAMNEGCDNRRPCESCTTREDVATELRRLAAEAQPTTQPKAQAAETPSMRLAQASMNAMADAITGARQDGAQQ